jgi:hypothetical protein
MPSRKRIVKKILGDLPLTAEIYWLLIQRGRPVTRNFSLRRTQRRLPDWCAQAKKALSEDRSAAGSPKRVLIFCTLRYWLEHAALMGITLAGMGHNITLSYLPYPTFDRPFSQFDLRRHNVYARKVLSPASDLIHPLSLLDVHRYSPDGLPEPLQEAIQEVSIRDTQYTLQVEHVDAEDRQSPSGRLFQIRQARNRRAAAAMFGWLTSLSPDKRPDVLLTPNGSILEMGAVYQTARFLGLPAVTYEFGEQRNRIWLAQNSEVMLQETDVLWEACRNSPLTPSQWEQIRSLYSSRQNGKLWENFARLWQGQPSQGGERARQALGLDDRPVILLAANVIGDSLTLGRQIFSRDMTEWLQRSVQFLASKPEIQLVVRIHPGERYLKGPSVAEVVKSALREIPPHIHLVEAQEPINTYDLIQIADLGLVYTTTVGMEMAMSGVPVIVGGKTHYRGKGFTMDPSTWDEYLETIEHLMIHAGDHRLEQGQVEQAWNYAYRFFFEYPSPFPWHLLDLWKELETRPIQRVLSDEGQTAYGSTFNYLVGEPHLWSQHAPESRVRA